MAVNTTMDEVLIMPQTPEERKRANIKAVKKAQEKTDAIMLRPSKEDGKQIRDAASAVGKTVSGYILDAVWEYMTTHPAPSASSDEV